METVMTTTEEVTPAQPPTAAAAGVYRFVNPIELTPIPAGHLTAGGSGDGVFLESNTAERRFYRYGATFLDDPDEVGLFQPEQVGRCLYRYPAAFTAGVDQAQLVGYRTLLTAAGRFFTDEAYAEPEVFQNYLNRLARPDSFSNEATGLAPTDTAGCFRLDPGDRRNINIPGAAVVLCSDEPLSYGSFLFRVVPKVLAIRKLGLTALPCIAYAHQEAYRNLLTLSGLPDASIVLHQMDAITHIERAVVPCLRNTHGYLDPESCELFAEMRAAYGDGRRGRRIYVSRLSLNQAGWSTRVMLNEAELIDRLAGIGFDIVTPEHLSVREQVAIFASADLVVGPSGSNMYNTMFCHPGTKVIDIQSEPQWIYSYTGMYASLQLNYGIFVGKGDAADPKTVHRRWTVNIDALIARIGSFLDQ
jgi:capsular polysaccharide biosynthesis protein